MTASGAQMAEASRFPVTIPAGHANSVLKKIAQKPIRPRM